LSAPFGARPLYGAYIYEADVVAHVSDRIRALFASPDAAESISTKPLIVLFGQHFIQPVGNQLRSVNEPVVADVMESLQLHINVEAQLLPQHMNILRQPGADSVVHNPHVFVLQRHSRRADPHEIPIDKSNDRGVFREIHQFPKTRIGEDDAPDDVVEFVNPCVRHAITPLKVRVVE